MQVRNRPGAKLCRYPETEALRVGSVMVR